MEKRIYMHQGAQAFLENNLRKSIEQGWDKWKLSDKMQCGLWASPFNERNLYTWENFWYNDFGNVERDVIRDVASTAGTHGCLLREFSTITDIYEFYNKPLSEQRERLSWVADFKDIEIADAVLLQWKNESKELLDEMMQKIKEKCVEFRQDAFFFTVNQDKILHINSMTDISQYMKKVQHVCLDFPIKAIDWDAIKADGYSGVELHNAPQFRWTEDSPTIFSTWDCDSIVIWDPECITPVDREIACIARRTSGAHIYDNGHSVCDIFDTCMDKDYLFKWAYEHDDLIQNLIQQGIVTQEDINATLFIETQEHQLGNWAYEDRTL